MAAYAATVTLPDIRAKKLAATGLGILRGTINVTNYNQTLAEITALTGYFRSAPTVILGGLSSLGYSVAWDTTSKSVKAWYPFGAHTHDLLFIGGIAATEPVVIAGGDTLGKNAATNRTIAGATSATKGGVVTAATTAAGVEVASDVNVGIVSFIAIGPAP